ncbi:MAG: hypothetical protein CM1200mP41_03690 [Gammaproteobacteria bacterium]|nr:MAG: hypothetical protein CM1200mP41_03690 [Gammaproteobacteria bacterium]
MASAGAANEIVRLLTDQPRVGERTLAAQDIAVLVRTHHEADWIEESLRNANVPTIRQTQDSVFETNEATDLERILIAIANPTLEASVRVALLTELLGHNTEDLERLAADAGQWENGWATSIVIARCGTNTVSPVCFENWLQTRVFTNVF